VEMIVAWNSILHSENFCGWLGTELSAVDDLAEKWILKRVIQR